MMPHISRLRSLLCCLAAVAGPAAARAEDPKEAAKESVKVTVKGILASETKNFIDPRLAEFAKEVQKKNPKLTGFRFANSGSEKLALGVTQTFPLADKETLDVTANASLTAEGKITITIKPPMLDQITYTCVCERYFSMATQYFTKDKERLFIAVTAKPCPGPEKDKPKEPATPK